MTVEVLPTTTDIAFNFCFFSVVSYSKLSSEWLIEAECLCKNVLRVTSSPAPSSFNKDAMLLHHFSSTLKLQLSDGIKLPAVSETFYVKKCIYCICINSVESRSLYLCRVLICWDVDCVVKESKKSGHFQVQKTQQYHTHTHTPV